MIELAVGVRLGFRVTAVMLVAATGALVACHGIGEADAWSSSSTGGDGGATPWDEDGHDSLTPGDASPSDAVGSMWPLVDATQWAAVEPIADPVAEHQPPDIQCPTGSWREEAGSFEVETGYCNYALFHQPLLQAIPAGARTRILAWHDVLAADSQAQGHIALAIDSALVWSETVEIPSEPRLFDVWIPIDEAVPAGAEVILHLHNHGYNTWNLVGFELEM